ncbi:hypothetical protein A9G45_02580 [Gilliamella sp. HK2]|uniref:DUF2800 domain-containing protein n=1 Tax=unclassified Gilliamella TaxID=2685620 RepID=UPI00080EDB3C|nr:DUF2800 domain-containing protein [Gilliamella apicola]OCG24199.1 hypothetical protein A9G46_09030 [Gilliamella apicola]OCG30590.1 hypothetical protein A9G45_02580 [Gilliamella apicola]
MTEHALISPSGAERWFNCPASLWLSKDEPEQSSEYAKEGTTAHALAEYCFKFKKKANCLLGMKTVVNDIYVDDEMAEAIQHYVDTVNGIKASMSNVLAFDVEQKLDFSELLDLSTNINTVNTDYEPEKSFGTADVVLLGDGELQVHDLKYGKGVRVSAENNKQLLIYALAAYYYYSLGCEISKVSVHIHQPRLNHYSEFSLSPDELLEFGKQLKEKAGIAYNIYLNGPQSADDFCAGESQCRFCKAAGKCDTLAQTVAKTIEADFENLEELDIENVSKLENSVLATKFNAIDLIKSWIKAVETRVQAELQQGNSVPGFKLVMGRQGNRAWANENDAENTLKSFRLKQDEMYTRKLISPTQALKVLKGSDKRIAKLEELITRPDGKPTVVPESDKRPAISPADDFTDLTQEDN